MWSRVWIVLVLVAAVSLQVSSFHSDAGPWVQATRGEIWPIPKMRIVKEDFYLLRPSNFDFRVSLLSYHFLFTLHYFTPNCQVILTMIILIRQRK